VNTSADRLLPTLNRLPPISQPPYERRKPLCLWAH